MDCISNHMFEFGICFNHSTHVSKSVAQILAECCTVQILGKHFHIVRDSDSKCWKKCYKSFTWWSDSILICDFESLVSARFSLWGSSHLWCICYGWSRTGDCTLAKQCCTNPMQCCLNLLLLSMKLGRRPLCCSKIAKAGLYIWMTLSFDCQHFLWLSA